MTNLGFSLALGLSATLGLIWSVLRSPPARTHQLVNAGLLLLFGMYAGGRLAFILLNPVYFQNHPAEAWRFPLAGFDWYGALAGGLLVFVVYGLVRRVPLGELADDLLPLLAVITIGSWLACWFGGCAYGPPIAAWWGLPARDEWGVVTRRWPVQIAGAILSLVFVWLIDLLPAKRLFPGVIFGLGIFSLSLVHFILSFVRVDPVPYFGLFRADTWGAAIFMIGSLLSLSLIWLVKRIKQRLLIRNETQTQELL
jgi:phosphatidylglycerol:prolipoprotein diacylglycerol transferase